MEDKRIHSWLQKVEQEAYELGLDYFIAVGKGSRGNAIVHSNNVCMNSNIKDIINGYNQLTRKFTQITFGDLYEYIQSAECDDYGYHFPFSDNDNVVFHIYNHRRQVNICLKDGTGNYTSKLNIIYDPECSLVNVVPVSNGVALYDNPKTINFHGIAADKDLMRIGTYKPLMDVEYNDSEEEFRDTHRIVVSMISDALGPWKAAKN